MCALQELQLQELYLEVSVLEVLVRQEKGNKDSLGEIKEDKKLTESLRKHL